MGIDEAFLKQKWQLLAGTSPLANRLGEQLMGRHREPHRYYHTLLHLQELFEWLDTLGKDLPEQELIGWSIWYHDAVYLPKRQDNEWASAQLAQADLPALGVPAEPVQTICRWIEATKTHLLSPEEQSDTALFFMDIDLAILGSAPEKYMEYTRQIRQEYRKIPRLLYRPGRCKVLQHFLTQPYIYQTEPCRNLWEAQARENLKMELGVFKKLVSNHLPPSLLLRKPSRPPSPSRPYLWAHFQPQRLHNTTKSNVIIHLLGLHPPISFLLFSKNYGRICIKS